MQYNNQRRNTRLAAYSIIITATSIVLLLLSMVLALRQKHLVSENNLKDEEISDLKENLERVSSENVQLSESNHQLEESSTGAKFRQKLKELALSGSSTIQMLKYFFTDQLVLSDSGSFHFYDILESLEGSGLNKSGFYRNDDGEITYSFEGTNSIKGIDVSKHNGTIDWAAVAASGVKFAFIRVGVRGYGSGGNIVKDENFDTNVDGALANGIAVGTYFFSQAINEQEAREEAAFVLENIKGKEIACPVACDIEQVTDSSSSVRTMGLSVEDQTNAAIAFCEEIKSAGYTPMIYGNIKTFILMLDITRLEDYQKWFAGYVSGIDTTPYYPYKLRVWQYSSTGNCPGVKGDCDMNIAFY